MNDLEKRIRTGIKFFRNLGGRNYDAKQVKAYLPHFLDLVERFLNGDPHEPEKMTDEAVEKLFTTPISA